MEFCLKLSQNSFLVTKMPSFHPHPQSVQSVLTGHEVCIQLMDLHQLPQCFQSPFRWPFRTWFPPDAERSGRTGVYHGRTVTWRKREHLSIPSHLVWRQHFASWHGIPRVRGGPKNRMLRGLIPSKATTAHPLTNWVGKG